jgi:acetate kinase
MYGIPYTLYKKYGIRRYGFHGTSHLYISDRACEILGQDINNSKIITCHLGNGASVSAIQNGKSIDTSMGFTPNEGLIMGTRSGDIDAGIIHFLMENEKIETDSINTLINNHSGMIGITGTSSDTRDIQAGFDEGDERSKLAIEMYAYRIKKYIGSYYASMNGVDTIVFTGGLGENGAFYRDYILKDLDSLGIKIDSELNKSAVGIEQVISSKDSKVKVIVVPTNEELVIARDTKEIVKTMNN